MTHNPPKKDRKGLSDWQPPVIFKTSDYFVPTSTEKESIGENTQETIDDDSSQTTDRWRYKLENENNILQVRKYDLVCQSCRIRPHC